MSRKKKSIFNRLRKGIPAEVDDTQIIMEIVREKDKRNGKITTTETALAIHYILNASARRLERLSYLLDRDSSKVDKTEDLEPVIKSVRNLVNIAHEMDRDGAYIEHVESQKRSLRDYRDRLDLVRKFPITGDLIREYYVGLSNARRYDKTDYLRRVSAIDRILRDFNSDFR